MWKFDTIIKRIESVKCISFDVFDTLLSRSISKPTDLFELMQLTEQYKVACKIHDFKSARIRAEREANQVKNMPTLVDIYKQFECINNINNVHNLIELEIDMEIGLCQPNKYIVEIFNYCIKKGKCVIITSDMYLSSITIEKMLKKCGIHGYKKIYVSCEIKKSKADGTIFDYIAKDNYLDKKEIIHIGDNIKSDFIKVLKSGVQAYHYKPPRIPEYTNIVNNESSDIIYKSINALSKNLYQREDSSYNLGLCAFGPLLTGFCQWLNIELRRDKIDKVCFLSRDGLIVKNIFDEFNDNKFATQYLYASRRSWTVPLIWKHSDLNDILSRISMSPRISVNIFLIRVGLKPNNYINIVKSFGLIPDEIFIKQNLFTDKRFIDLYKKIRADVISNSKNEYAALSNYIKRNIKSGRLALVDIGYNGTMQYAIEELFSNIFDEITVIGYYVALNPKAALLLDNKLKAKGFLYEPGRNEIQCEKTASYIAIFEASFLAQHGSVEKFELHKEKSRPLFYEYEYNFSFIKKIDEKNIITQYQKGAIDFARYWLSNRYLQTFSIAPQTAIVNMNLMGRKPNKVALNTFGDFRVFDTQITLMASPKKITRYIIHPKTLKQDFMNSVWKIGFMRRLFGANFPSELLYEFMKKKYHQKIKHIGS